MPAKIRLARRGKKKNAFYHIVIADSRAPRDGKFIDQVGFYNPNTDPATIELDFNKTLNWLQKGAEPTDTCKVILSDKGVLYKKHLLQGVKKNALTEEQAEAKFNEWLKEKEEKIKAFNEKQEKSQEEIAKKRLEAEMKHKEEKAALVAKKNAKEAEKASEEAADAAVADKPANASAHDVAVEEVKSEAPAEPAVEEVKNEAPAEPAVEEEKAAE